MKNIFLLSLILFFATVASAAPFGGYRPKSIATRVSGEIFDNTTAKVLAAAVTGIDCETSKYNDTTAPLPFADLTNAETVIGTNGQFWVDLTIAETNITDGTITVKCSATNTNASDFIVSYTTRKAVIADGGIGSLAQGFDGVTIAEGTNTLDLAASTITIANQFVGDKIALFSTTGKYYGSGCITASVSVTNRVTTDIDLAALHTVGDYYVLRPDAGCSITAAKIATGAITSTKFATGAIDANAIAGGAITANSFAAGAIDANAIASSAITSTKFALGAIDAAAIAPDAIAASELATTASDEIVTAIFAKTIVAISALPTDGTETFEKIVRSLYQRFFHKVVDNTGQAERQIFQTGGVTKWCESPTSATGGIFTNGVCGAVD